MTNRPSQIVLSFALLAAAGSAAFAQTPPSQKPAPHAKPAVVSNGVYPKPESSPAVPNEKAIATVSKPNIWFCASEGKITIRGWQRDEVRVMTEGGSINFKVSRRSAEEKPSAVQIQGFDPAAPRARDECLRGAVEIEVPYGASVNKIKIADADLTVESIAKIVVESVNGDVRVREIAEETNVSTISGDILAEDLSGKISLKSYPGTIIAQRLKPVGADDAVSAKSVGNVVLKNVSHSFIEANSMTGELVLSGGLTPGGSYEFTTMTGGVTLMLPADASFSLRAALSDRKNFQSDFPLKTVPSNIRNGQTELISGTFGTGETTINLTAAGGFLKLKKNKPTN